MKKIKGIRYLLSVSCCRACKCCWGEKESWSEDLSSCGLSGLLWVQQLRDKRIISWCSCLLYWICYLFVLLVEKLTNGFDWIYIIIIAWWHQNCNRITLLLHYNNLSLGGVVSEKFIQYRVTAYLKHILLIFVTNKYVLLCFYFYW